MQLLIDIYCSLSWLSPSIQPQDSAFFLGFIIMLAPMFITLAIADNIKYEWVNKILITISFITLIASPVMIIFTQEPIEQGIEAPTYLKEQITNVKQSKDKHQIYTNDGNIELTFIYKDLRHKPSIHDDYTYHIGKQYYQDEAVSAVFDEFPSSMDVPIDVFRYDVFPIQKAFKDFDPNQLDNTVYGYLTGTKNEATQTTRAMLQKENIHVIETEDARKHPDYASYQVSKIEATDGTATATRNGQSKQVKIKNLYITMRKFISDKDQAKMEADKKAEDDKKAVNKLIN